jgi:hypothetical protein
MLTLACLATAISAGPDPGLDLALRLEGVWDNGAQVAIEGDPARPHLHVRHIAFESDAADGALVYAELRVGGPRGELYRQRVYEFGASNDPTALNMAIWTLVEPDNVAGAAAEELSGLTAEALERFNPGCDFLWREADGVWTGAIEDGACRITSSRSGIEMIINGEFTISADRFTHSESGRNAATNEHLFGPPGGVPNLYDRVDD